MLIDSDAVVNIIDEITYNQFEPKPVLHAADARIVVYGSKDAMMLLGSFETDIRYKKAVKAVFHIPKDVGGCLLS